MTASIDLGAKAILLTGACGALGTAIAATLGGAGAIVVANDIMSSLDAAAVLPSAVRGYVPSACETSEEARDLVAEARALFGRLPEVVCCHAGLVESHPVEEYPLEVFDSIMKTNVRSGFLLAQAASAAWKQEGRPGLLLFTSSWVATVPWPGIAPYSASKAAITQFTRSFARELAPYGIRANAIAPGIVAAGMAKRQWDTEPDYRRRAGKAVPLGFLQEPQSVADAFLFMCSELSSYMTGSVLLVDGGCSLYPLD